LADRAYEIARRAAELASEVAAAAERPVLVAGSIGPTGELLVPLGVVTEQEATAAFAEEAAGLRDGGADIAWIETKSAPEEMRAAARAAIEVGLPYSVTGSFDTAGRTMMGLAPSQLSAVFADLDVGPVAIGANCGVGASDLLVAIQEIDPGGGVLIAKSNCGVPRFEGTDIVYSGDPVLMSRYATLAVDSGARIIGGCCGTSPEHLAEMKRALDAHIPGRAPSVDEIVATVGPLANPPAATGARSERRSSRRRGV
jgi:5-methyltetrahydrofolate--homocysteine methyltransferase